MSGRDWFPLQDLERGDNSARARLPVDSSNPWFDGHFPSQPLLPGVALLALVSETLRCALGEERAPVLERMSKVRFVQVVRPGPPLEIQLEWKESGDGLEVRFTALQGEATCARGRLGFGLPGLGA